MMDILIVILIFLGLVVGIPLLIFLLWFLEDRDILPIIFGVFFLIMFLLILFNIAHDTAVHFGWIEPFLHFKK